MPTLTIDNRQVEVPPGATLLDAARALGIEIPTLCHLPGRPADPACMVCLVKRTDTGQLVPSCAAPAEDGLVVESDTDEVHRARRAALELLLSDHLGDCDAPCHVACPAYMDIPRMIRQIAAGRLDEAIATVKAHIPLPAVLGRICPAPCERACRRREADAPLAICLLKRYVADVDLTSPQPYLPDRRADSGKHVAVVGAGPAGLAAAYYLRQYGHGCTVFDAREQPGGQLRTAVPQEKLPRDVLDAEIGVIQQLGAELRMRTHIGPDVSLKTLREEFDAVLLAVGKVDAAGAEALGVPAGPKGLLVEAATGQTPEPGVFAAGGAVRAGKLAVRAVADGRNAAVAIDAFLAGRTPAVPARRLSTHVGKPHPGEIERFLEGAGRAARTDPGAGLAAGFDDAEARAEAARCLHCDCRKADACKLREHAERYAAHPGRGKGDRRTFAQDATHPDVVYEPGKCIGCGLCVRLAAEAGEPIGLTFVGRGFKVRMGVPFGHSLREGLQRAAAACVAACPTGALAAKG